MLKERGQQDYEPRAGVHGKLTEDHTRRRLYSNDLLARSGTNGAFGRMAAVAVYTSGVRVTLPPQFL